MLTSAHQIAVPVARWSKCSACGALIYFKRLERNLRVCPECNQHFRLSARQRAFHLLDQGTFIERDVDLASDDPLGFVDSKPYRARLEENRLKTDAHEAAIWGRGSIGGLPIVFCALDFTFLGGSMGAVVGEKVTRAIEHGAETRTPVLVCSSSGGARMQEGAISLMQMAKTASAVGLLAERGVPLVSLLTDPTYGGVSASFAMLGDVILAEPRARVGFAGPQVIEQTIRQKLPEGFQTAEFLLEKGQIDLIVPRAELRSVCRRLLAHHQRRATALPGRRANERERLAAPLQTRHSEPARLSAWDIVQLARHPERPQLLDYVDLIFDGFVELHGDRAGFDDPAIVGGLASIGGRSVMLIGTQKGRSTRERVRRNFGMPQPQGYRKALRLMQYAGRMGLPVVTLIDTPGAFPGLDAETHNQSEAIARNLLEMTRLPVPILATVTGEGGSGGALALGVGNRVLMLQHAIYSVISPEGCATILFKDAAGAARAAEMSRLTAHDLLALGVADEIVPEPAGGAHEGPVQTAAALKEALLRHLATLDGLSGQELIADRRARFRAFGEAAEATAAYAQFAA